MAENDGPYQTYLGLRRQSITIRPGDLGIPEQSFTGAFGVVMDLAIGGGTATLAAFISGDASLYFSSGGGVIGAKGYESIASATRRFVSITSECAGQMAKADEYPLPSAGVVRFYALTALDVVTAEDWEEELIAGRSRYSNLAHAGQGVITQFRLSGLLTPPS